MEASGLILQSMATAERRRYPIFMFTSGCPIPDELWRFTYLANINIDTKDRPLYT
ncbi:hypothetical protein MIMGU_mgv1a017599mg [Erythranthe guttata]|uniref:Uncharacterized protein n=1 Tax=Erythranthe guttata TaxID=4155 RepID=A0A022RE59_ERYGU|nr:hypothetical protein MIMGU_mgv1a017599mg [Erythranthe guttata]